MVVLPVVAFAFALRNSDVNQASFYWNIACFFNTTFLAVVVFYDSIRRVLQSVSTADIPLSQSEGPNPDNRVCKLPNKESALAGGYLLLRLDFHDKAETLDKTRVSGTTASQHASGQPDIYEYAVLRNRLTRNLRASPERRRPPAKVRS